jgi:hypothetical protein
LQYAIIFLFYNILRTYTDFVPPPLDMAVYTVFSALGLKLQVRAILDTDTRAFNDYLENYEENFFDDRLEEEEAYVPPPLATHAVVGTLGGHGLSDDVGGELDDYETVVSAWSTDWRKVVWVNGPRQSDLDMVHMTVSVALYMMTNKTDSNSMATRLALGHCTRVPRFLSRCRLRACAGRRERRPNLFLWTRRSSPYNLLSSTFPLS